MNEESEYNEINNNENNNIFEYESLHYSSNSLQNTFNCINRFIIYFYFIIENNEFVYPIETDFLNILKKDGYDMIKNIIKNINKKQIIINLNSINYILSLKDCDDENYKYFYDNNYALKPCHKKTLKPKNDCPNYNNNSLLKELTDETISFICTNEINIMLIEKYDDYEILNNNKEYENIIDKDKKINNINEKKCNKYCLLI